MIVGRQKQNGLKLLPKLCLGTGTRETLPRLEPLITFTQMQSLWDVRSHAEPGNEVMRKNYASPAR